MFNVREWDDQRLAPLYDHRYSFAKGMGLGIYLSSDPFTVGGYDWVIHFYLDGEISAQRNSTHVSIFVVFAANRPAALRHCLSYLVGPERVGEAQGYRMPPSQVYSRQTATFGACPILKCLYLFTLEKKLYSSCLGLAILRLILLWIVLFVHSPPTLSTQVIK